MQSTLNVELIYIMLKSITTFNFMPNVNSRRVSGLIMKTQLTSTFNESDIDENDVKFSNGNVTLTLKNLKINLFSDDQQNLSREDR